MRRSPLLIEMAFVYYKGSDPQTSVGFDWNCAPALEAREWMKSNGLLYGVKLTEKGHAWVKAIIETPIPKCVWVVDRESTGEQE